MSGGVGYLVGLLLLVGVELVPEGLEQLRRVAAVVVPLSCRYVAPPSRPSSSHTYTVPSTLSCSMVPLVIRFLTASVPMPNALAASITVYRRFNVVPPRASRRAARRAPVGGAWYKHGTWLVPCPRDAVPTPGEERQMSCAATLDQK
jgi:hypothetical protein